MAFVCKLPVSKWNKNISYIEFLRCALSNTIATSHKWLLNTWNVTSSTEKVIFYFILIDLNKFKNWYSIQLLEKFQVCLKQPESTFTTIDFVKYKFILSISKENLAFWCALNVKYTLKFEDIIQKK